MGEKSALKIFYNAKFKHNKQVSNMKLKTYISWIHKVLASHA